MLRSLPYRNVLLKLHDKARQVINQVALRGIQV